MKQKNQGFIIPILITVFALLAVGGGAYFYVHENPNLQIIKQDENIVEKTFDSYLNNQNTQNSINQVETDLVKKESLPKNPNSDQFIKINEPSGGNYIVGDNIKISWFKSENIRGGLYMNLVDIKGEIVSPELTHLGIGGPDLTNWNSSYNLNTEGYPEGKYKIRITTYGKDATDIKADSAFFNLNSSTKQSPIACTMDAKQCPDGSYVGRTGPNCEFVCSISPTNESAIR